MTKGVGGSSAGQELQSLGPWADPAPPIAIEERSARIEQARELMTALKVGALLVGAGASLRYFTGVAWGQTERLVAMILPRRGRPVMICPAFELGSLEASLLTDADIRVWEEHENPCELVAAALTGFGLDSLALDPQLPFFIVDGLRRAAPSLSLINAAPIVDGCRRVKSPAELALMRQAKAMTL